jgi:hypothetical protein
MVIESSARGNATVTAGSGANAIGADGRMGYTGMEASMREHVMSKHRILIGVAAVLLGAWGCNKQSSSPGASTTNEGGESSEGGDAPMPTGAVHKSGGDKATATMGPAGGTLDIASGARVEIPPGTFSEATDVVITLSQGTTAFFNDEHEKPVGPTFEVSPAMQAPDGQSIRVSIPLASYPEGWGDASLGYEYPEGARVGAEDSEHTKWQYENAKLSGGRAVAEVSEVAGYRLQFVLTNLEAQ